MTKKKMLHFVMYVSKPWKMRYWLLLGKMPPSSQKGFEAGRRLYIQKRTNLEYSRKIARVSLKSAVERQVTLPSKSYGKIPKMASKSSANEQKENREIILKILENVRFLGKIYLIYVFG